MAHYRVPVSIYFVDTDTNEETFYENATWYFPQFPSNLTTGSTWSSDESVLECMLEYRGEYSSSWPKQTYFWIDDNDFFVSEGHNTRQYFNPSEVVSAAGGNYYDMTEWVGRTVKAYLTGDSDNRYILFEVPELEQTVTEYTTYTKYLSRLSSQIKIKYGSDSYEGSLTTSGFWTVGSGDHEFRYYLYNDDYYDYYKFRVHGFTFVPTDTENPTYLHGFLIEEFDDRELLHKYNYEIGTYKASTSTYNTMLTTWADGISLDTYDGSNPYDEGGTDQTSSSTGNFSEDSDTVEADELPTYNAIGSGFATLFTPTKPQLKNLADLFWSSTILDFLQNVATNITDMFISLSVTPFELEAATDVDVTWFGISTAITLGLAPQQYYEIDLGSIDLANDNRIFTSGSALDYSPFSRLGIYLPFIGTQELDIDECRDSVISLRYRIDILSGACVAIINVGGSDLYQFSGNCLTQIPITNENMQSIFSDVVNVAIAAGTAKVAAAGGGAAVAEEAATTEGVTGAGILAKGNLLSATANAAMNMKPQFNKTGSVSSSASLLAVKQPYLFLKTPRQSMPSNYNHFNGYPSNIRANLGSLDGYTQVEEIVLENLPDLTVSELEELERILKEGFYI